jgi:hypothetical protein
VSRTLAESVVDFLSFSGTTSDHITKLRRVLGAKWKQAIPWLHDAGLALYLLQKPQSPLDNSQILRQMREAADRNSSAYLYGSFSM